MKKTLLLLCALMTSATMSWAQNNLTLGKTVVPLGGVIQPSSYAKYSSEFSEEQKALGVSETQMQLLTKEGNTTTVLLYPQYNDQSSTSDPIQGFYIDLGAEKNIGAVQITWETAAVCATNFTVSLTNTEPASTGTGVGITVSGATTIVNESVGNISHSYNFSGSDVKSGRYIVFQATAGANPAWGVKMRTFVAYDDAAAALTSFSVSPIIFPASTATALTATALDATGKTYASVSYQIDGADVDLSSVNLTAGSHTLTAIDGNDASNTINKTIYAISSIPAAPTAATMYELYTASASPNSWGGNGTVGDEITIDSKKAKNVTLEAGKNVTTEVTAGMKVKDYNKVSVAIFPTSTFTNAAVALWAGNHFVNGKTLTAGEWNIIEYGYTNSTEDNVNSISIINEGSSTVDILVANAVVYYDDPTTFKITEDGVVTGTITSSDVASITASTASVIDLRGATLDGSITEIPMNASNPNQLLLVKAETATDATMESAMGDQLTGNTQNVIISDGTYYWAYQPLVFTDDNAHQFAQLLINAKTKGFTANRTIAANKWVTTYFPADQTLATDGVDVYEATSYDTENNTLAFTKKENGLISANTPYIINTTKAVTLTMTGNIDVDLRGTAAVGSNDFGSSAYKLVGNLATKTVAAGETIYGFSGGELKFRKASEGAKIGAFRSYLTTTSSTPAPALDASFTDGYTTYVGKIQANGEVEITDAYNMAGQRVNKGQKGLNIVNGKKFIVK